MMYAVYPVIATIGPFTIHTFALLIDLGLAATLAWLYWRAPHGRRMRWIDTGLATMIGGFVGARLLYAIINSGYYTAHPAEVFQIWLGGLSWPGAAAGGLFGLWFYCRRINEPLAPLLDALALPIALMNLLIWGGCWAGSCAYGIEVTPGNLPVWLTSTAPDLYGLVTTRFATQTVGIVWGLICLAAVGGLSRRFLPPGALGLIALGLTALGALVLGFTRGDPMPLIGKQRLDVIGSALTLAAAAAGLGALYIRKAGAKTPSAQC